MAGNLPAAIPEQMAQPACGMGPLVTFVAIQVIARYERWMDQWHRSRRLPPTTAPLVRLP
jgi:hypothetical protein